MTLISSVIGDLGVFNSNKWVASQLKIQFMNSVLINVMDF